MLKMNSTVHLKSYNLFVVTENSKFDFKENGMQC